MGVQHTDRLYRVDHMEVIKVMVSIGRQIHVGVQYSGRKYRVEYLDMK